MPGGISAQEQTLRTAGALVRLKPEAFESLLVNEPIEVVIGAPRYWFRWSVAGDGFIQRGWQYLATSRGVLFHATSKRRLSLPSAIRFIEAEDVWISFLAPK